jgi:2-oxoacid:acceptor oxidoreductase delta subunit (pyruvate/2-ketoisovalerate family)
MKLRIKYPQHVAEIEQKMGQLKMMKTGYMRFQRPITKLGKCNQCGTCYIYCPEACISDRGSCFASDLDYCKGCGICARVCPENAIIMVKE